MFGQLDPLGFTLMKRPSYQTFWYLSCKNIYIYIYTQGSSGAQKSIVNTYIWTLRATNIAYIGPLGALAGNPKFKTLCPNPES